MQQLQTPTEVRVLEVGVGTGCISLSIATERPQTRVYATDLSPKAIALATHPARRFGPPGACRARECDLVEGVAR